MPNIHHFEAGHVPRHHLNHMPPVHQNPLSPEDLHRSRVIPVAYFRCLNLPQAVPYKDNLEKRIIGPLKREAAEYGRQQSFDGVSKVMGPQDIVKFMTLDTRSFRGKSMMITGHDFPATSLYIEENRVCSAVPLLREFPRGTLNDIPLDLPYGENMMHFESGEPPKLIRTPRDSHVALVKEDWWIANWEMLPVQPTSSRLLSETEKQALRVKPTEEDLFEGAIRLLEFKNIEERNTAADAPDMKFLEAVHFNTSFLKDEIVEDYHLRIDFDLILNSEKNIVESLNDLLVQYTGRIQLACEKTAWTVFRVAQDSLLIKLDSSIGEQMLESLELRENEKALFELLHAELRSPRLVPIFRFTFSINRDVRALFEDELRSFQCSSRMREIWHPQEDTGLLRLEGSDIDLVRAKGKHLKGMLLPIIMNCDLEYTELLFGIGEAYARNVAHRYRCMIDIDKFTSVICLFGIDADIAHQDLINFQNKKQFIEVNVVIPIHEPHLNGNGLLNPEVLDHMGISLKARCEWGGNHINFTGTVEAYELLIAKLHEVSEAFHKNFLDLDDQFLPRCPVCTDHQISGDFFRPSCGHTMCRNCVNFKTQAALDVKMFVIKCDTKGCGRSWTLEDFFNVILGDDRRIKSLDGEKLKDFRDAARRSVLSKDHDAMGCRRDGCKGIWTRSPGLLKKECMEKGCTYVYCGRCFFPEHPNKTCEEAAPKIDDSSINTYVQSVEHTANRTRRCPTCLVLIQRTEGCLHMTCICGTHFCFSCRLTGSERTVKHHCLHHHQEEERLEAQMGNRVVEDRTIIPGYFVSPDYRFLCDAETGRAVLHFWSHAELLEILEENGIIIG